MLYHNVKNSDENRKIKMIEELEKWNYSSTFYKKAQLIAENLEIEKDKVTGKKKSTWKKEVKEKVISNIKTRMIEMTAGRTKC